MDSFKLKEKKKLPYRWNLDGWNEKMRIWGTQRTTQIPDKMVRFNQNSIQILFGKNVVNAIFVDCSIYSEFTVDLYQLKYFK